jgi:hypothetical protein
MTTRSPLPFIGSLALLLFGCGHRGDPLPPLRRTPPAPTDFRFQQRGAQLELVARAPASSVDNVTLTGVGIEFLHGGGKGDLEKTGARTLVKAAAGGLATATLPLPLAGTLVRAAARAVAGGQRGARTLTLALVAQPPLETPNGLVATPAEDGVRLSWHGARPQPVAAPVGPATPGRAGLSAAAGTLPRAATPAPGATPATTPAAPTTAPPTTAPPTTAPPTSAPSTSAPPTTASPTAAPPAASPPPEAKPAPRRNGFYVYRRAAEGSYAAPLAEEPLDRHSFVDAAAPLGARLCYVVRAVASTEPLIESAASNEVCVQRTDVTPPASPAGLTVLPRAGGLELLWSPSAEEDLAGYRVYRATLGAAPEKLSELPAARTSFLDETAGKGVACRYTVTAFDQAGNESAPGEPVEATLP